jgi:hypothetical protein
MKCEKNELEMDVVDGGTEKRDAANGLVCVADSVDTTQSERLSLPLDDEMKKNEEEGEEEEKLWMRVSDENEMDPVEIEMNDEEAFTLSEMSVVVSLAADDAAVRLIVLSSTETLSVRYDPSPTMSEREVDCSGIHCDDSHTSIIIATL